MHLASCPRIAGLVLVLVFAASCDYIERASVSTAGNGPHGRSIDPSISADGRYVAFASPASDLVAADRNGRSVSMPTIDSVTPDAIARGSSATLTVLGGGFLPVTVALSFPGVTVDSITVISENELHVSVTVDPDASLGPRPFFVWALGTGPGGAATNFAVCQCLSVT